MTADLAKRATAAALLALVVASTATPAGREEGRWEKQTGFAPDDFVSNVITALTYDDDGTLWVGTDNGLVWSQTRGRSWQLAHLERARPIYGSGGPRRRFDRSFEPEALPDEALVRRNTITSLAVGRKGLWVGTLNGLCLSDRSEPKKRNWYVFSPTAGAPGPEIWAVAELQGVVWVSARGGIYRSVNSGKEWRKVRVNRPDPVTSITLMRRGRGTVAWLSGFDAAPQRGGGMDLLSSWDDGKTWRESRTRTAPPLATNLPARTHKVVALGTTLWACTRHGLARSDDGGGSWEKVRHRSGLAADEVFDLLEADDQLWAATSEGVFYSADNGETWGRDEPLRAPVRRMIEANRSFWLATNGGLLQRVGRNWRVFTVRSEVLCSILGGDSERRSLWVGTAGGLSFSRNNGRTWQTLSIVDGLPSNRILSLAVSDGRVWAGTDGGMWTLREGTTKGRAYDRSSGLHGLRVRDVVAAAGKIWAATDRGVSVLEKPDGQWRTMATDKSWFRLCVLEETETQPEVILGAVAGGRDRMAVVRLDPDTEKIEELDLPGHHGTRVHQFTAAGDVVWAATDTGLFRSRDRGVTWTRFGAESLWASRITCVAQDAKRFLCVQAEPSDPPAPTAILNFTHNGGRSWEVLPARVPGHARTLLMSEDLLIAGTRDGLYFYRDYAADLRPLRAGWRVWNRIAALAASSYRRDRLGWVSTIDDYAMHRPTFWLASNGAGAVERGAPTLDPIRRTWDVTGAIPLDVTSFSHFPGERIYAVTASPDGVWFGTAQGLIQYKRIGMWRQIRPSANGLCNAPVRALASRNGAVWAGTDSGLSVFNVETDAWRTYRAADSLLPDDRVTALAFDGENIWGGTARGGFRVDQDGQWLVVLPEERIFGIDISSARQYYATERGVFALDRAGRVRRQLNHRNCPALTDNRVFNVFVDGPDLWAATRDGVRRILHDPAEPETELSSSVSLRGPDGVLVVVNADSPDSVKIGEAYAAMRRIPARNICRINSPDDEVIWRSVYEHQIRRPVWRHLMDKKLDRRISFIVTTRGVPLRIREGDASPRVPRAARRDASVDSELALLARRHPLGGGVPNPYLHREELFDSTRFGLYLVTRLDGPSAEEAIAMARRALSVEKNRSFGSRGFVRFDLFAGKAEEADRVNAAILRNYAVVRRQIRLSGRITPPESTALPFFRPGSCFNTLFFLGWGVDEYRPKVFSWVWGAVGLTLDPNSAATLHNPEASWVAGAIHGGITATIGLVGYDRADRALSVAALYRYLMAGFTWAEAAYMCIPELSWQTVVIGDPLYTPFK